MIDITGRIDNIEDCPLCPLCDQPIFVHEDSCIGFVMDGKCLIHSDCIDEEE